MIDTATFEYFCYVGCQKGIVHMTEVKPSWPGLLHEGGTFSEPGDVFFFLVVFFLCYSCTLRNHMALESPNRLSDQPQFLFLYALICRRKPFE